MIGPVAITAAGLFLLWPALFNGYPILFVDSMAYLQHGLSGDAPWDKTVAYGPFLWLFHQSQSLWGPALAQAFILSHLLWLTQRVACGVVTPGRHMVVVLVLAGLTAAPWFVSLLMPDIFAAMLVLCLYLLAFGQARLGRLEMAWVALLAAFALAVHLSHLPLALALCTLILLIRREWRAVLRCALPMLAAILFLLGANWHGFGRATLSPHGSVFLLARLQEDGPAVWLLRSRCPEAGWHLCGFLSEMPMDSDLFLWSPQSPSNRDPDGRPRVMGNERLSPEARDIVAATIAAYPWEVARLSLANGWRQLGMTRLGDSFDAADLDEFAKRVLHPYFPEREARAFEASEQMRDGFQRLPFTAQHQPVLVGAALALLLGWWRLARNPDPRDAPRLGLILCVLVGVSGNALAAGALSKPHHRYQARIAWLLPLAAILAIPPLPARREEGIKPAQPPR